MKKAFLVKLAALGLSLSAAMSAQAQRDFSKVEIKSEPVAENLYMLTGLGGNIGLFVGEDGAFMVDDQFAPLSEKILAEVAKLTDKPLRFVINTHWHGDHTGGNENMGKAGALIVAHENVRKRMSTEQFTKLWDRTTPPAPADALPVITFTDATTFYWNGDEVRVQHVGPAHTDGDSIIHFKNANAIHMGDTFFNGSYPYIDISAGGVLDGVIENARKVIEMSDDNTRIIPGHGPLTDKKGLQSYHDLLVKLKGNIKALVDKGMSKEEVIAANPTKEFDEKYGQGFMKPDVWTGIVYDSIKQQ
ncbi:MBL fold metallo-hydrolase [Microbulbifer agarilyticus]|uniref:MBL fold metallo-hydrolase n=1 Tax=Microbulbifer agarilyticus TaxID=260552 RepID=UPI001C95B757|nr:MBL fold metallo-hydrolase [Microbulbifer agarilyticus]MBY6190399.1 MBL fold metallo-hydrolase [Microbulbifer agarilyticus]MCA0892885.1 MBL fold metallo-hydrolase [Microbulbifer agarilyticus]